MTRIFYSVILAVISITVASAQDVLYYKLTRKMENGKSSTNVSGGQYITFIADICYESNKKGIGVGHGNMTRNKSYSTSEYTTYFGSSYWGDDVASFKFNADKSVLNVVIDKDNYYIYKRATAPAGQETCSLIRKPSSGGNTGGAVVGGITPPPVYPVDPYNPIPAQSSNSNAGTTQQNHKDWWHYERREVTEDCYMCHGSGKCNSCNGTHSIWNEFGGGKIECPNCRPDGKCTTCGGTGKITKQRLY